MSEGRNESVQSPQASGVKVLEVLKKHLFEHQDTSSKTLSSREVCSSFSELTAAVFSTSQRANSSVVVSGAIELLVHACSSHDRAIRLAGQENLYKLIKGLQSSNLSRLQQDLFHELKKNGSARSLSVALEVFAALFPKTRPSRRQSLSQSLFPVLLRLLSRAEEGLHEALQESLSHILPTMTPFISAANIQLMMTAVLELFPESPASYRRMAASVLTSLTSHSKSPETHTHWLVGKMMIVGFNENATEQSCQGVLLTLQNMMPVQQDHFRSDIWKQAYGFVLSCILYRDGNTAVAAMETMYIILVSSRPPFSHWLTSSDPDATMATQFMQMSLQGGGDVEEEGREEEREERREEGGEEEGEKGDGKREEGEEETRKEEGEKGRHPVVSGASSLEEGIHDTYFDSDQESSPMATPSHEIAALESVHPLPGSLAVQDGPTQPLASLVQYLQDVVLSSKKVSAVSVGLACLAACADLSPSLLPSLSPYLPFTAHSDPKLKSRSAKVLAVLLRALLREHCGECVPLVSEAALALQELLNDESPVVLKAVCESLRICLPSLATSSRPQLAVDLVQQLLIVSRSSTYWLAKVELLRTLACLPLTALALSLPSFPHSLLSQCVFPLLGDSDHRVRTAASEAIVQLVPSLQMNCDPILAHSWWESSREFPSPLSQAPQLSLATVGVHGSKTIPPTPLGLQHVLWFLVGHISSSESRSLQRGCLEALHILCQAFPPPSLPDPWGCRHVVPTLLCTSISLLSASHLAWTVQGHQQLLDVCSAVFLTCSLSAMTRSAQCGQATPTSGSGWAALGDPDLVGYADLLLRHTARLLALFVHVIEGREPETRETRRVPMVSPKKAVGREGSPVRTTPAKPKVQIIENLQKPPLIPRDGIGQFASLHHYLKILDACRSAYTNYQVSLVAVGEDKFSRLLQSTHNMATTLLEVALAADVGKYVEELMTYFTHTFKVDPSGALLCVQQLLNALFGMNAAAQHTFLHSPFLSSLTFDLSPLHRVSSPSPSHTPSLMQVTLSQPLGALESWLEAPPPHPHLSPSTPSPPLPRKRGLFPSRRTLVVKPVNSVSSVKDYIAYFEPLVVSVVKKFPFSSSHLLQQRTLFLLVQLLQLKVRYELLDCNHTFLESVLKLVGLMESGVVRDGEDLVPFLFQFLVLLAYDNSQLVSVPQVMQRCDAVMASGHSVDTFAIPALQPLVLNLFVRPGSEGPELETQREVVLSMLLRVVDHSRVLSLLTHVLDCFSHSAQHWHRVSSQILASLLNAVARLSLVLDSADSMATLYHLFSAMDPSAISMKALFVALLKQPVLRSVQQFCRWLTVVNSALTLMLTLFPDSTVYSELSDLPLAVAGVKSNEVEVTGESALPLTEGTATRLGWFLLGILRVAGETEQALIVMAGGHPQPHLPQLLGRLLLLLSSLVSGMYESLRAALSSISPPPSLASIFLSLTPTHPLLTLHYCHLSMLTGSHDWVKSVLQEYSGNTSSGYRLLHHCLLPLVTGANNSVFTSTFTQHTLSTDPQKREALLVQLMTSDLSRPGDCAHALQVAREERSLRSLRLLCSRLVCHPLSVISTLALDLTLKLLTENTVSSELANELLGLLHPHGNRYPELCTTLQQLGGHCVPPPFSPSHPLQSTITLDSVSQPWLLSEVHELCATCQQPWLCGRVLSRLSFLELTELMDSDNFRKGLLEVCLCLGLELSFSSAMVTPHSDVLTHTLAQGLTSHPLLQASSSILMRRVSGDPADVALLPGLMWLLLSWQQLPPTSLDTPAASAILALIRSSLKQATMESCTLTQQVALDCVSLSLAVPELQRAVDDMWIGSIVSCVAGMLEMMDGDHTATDYSSSSQKLHSAFTRYLSGRLPPPLGLHIETALLSLARLPTMHASSLIPPLLLSSSDQYSLSEQALDQALLEGEVLQQYMGRSNCVGWLSRPQFEERWMQLLGVVNQPPPSEGMPVEEVYAHSLNMCVGVVGVVSLLLATSLRPQPGNPVSCELMHTHRNRDVLFLGTKPGRRLGMVRRLVEKHVLLQCGARTNLYSNYQHPLLAHLSPPLFSRNVERGPGDTGLGPGQLSLKSLWPIALVTPKTARYLPENVDVDVQSCVLSLVDLFSHWLSHPMHTLLLLHTLRAILMLSDLFSVASQFEWMLETTCELSEKQPFEDSGAHSLLIHCLLKAAAVLKVEGQQVDRIVRLTERALDSESLHVQNGCLRGLLFVAEDPNGQLASQLGPTLARYLPHQLEEFHRHTELHSCLCWSLAVSLALHHSHLLREPEFPGHLLERAIPLLLHPHTSTLLFHAICLGLELLVINFTFSSEQRTKITSIAASRCAKCELGKLLPALALLVSCMYTVMYSGEQSSEGDVENEETAETSIQTREHVSMLMEILRHGPLEGVKFLVDVIPVLMTDFMPPVEVLQMVVTEFVSPHQPRPIFAAMVMGETFSLLLGHKLVDLVTNWVLLSMDSFVQQEPENKAVWSLLCLLTAASSSSILRAMLEVVAYQQNMPLPRSRSLLATATTHFYSFQASVLQRQALIQKFQSSTYSTLNAIAHTCLHS